MNIESIKNYYQNFPTSLQKYFDKFPFEILKLHQENVLSLIDICSYYTTINPRIESDNKSLAINNPNFNIWRAVGLERSELKYCSFLRWLLDPRGSHYQGDKFLSMFIKYIPEIAEKINLVELYKTEVRQEEYINSSSRVDLILKGTNFLIAIEAKIGAYEQEEQLQRYREAINHDNLFLIFLTVDGRVGVSDFNKSCINIKWLHIAELCRKFSTPGDPDSEDDSESCKNQIISEIVRQYGDMLKSL